MKEVYGDQHASATFPCLAVDGDNVAWIGCQPLTVGRDQTWLMGSQRKHEETRERMPEKIAGVEGKRAMDCKLEW